MLASSLFLLFVQKLARLLLCQRIRGSVKTNAKGNAKESLCRTVPRRAPPHPSAHAPRCAWRAPQGSPAAILSSSAEMADESFHGPFSHGASSFGAANNLGGLISYFSSTNQCAP